VWLTAEELQAQSSTVLSIFDSWRDRAAEGAPWSQHERLALNRLLETAATASPGLSDWSGLCYVEGEPCAAWLERHHST